MKNEIGRKITSLTLMTIMLAGGMTIAFPGFTPDAYAVNANLFVSAENTGGYVDGAQVIEILVIDEDLASTALPDITVNGDAVAMTRTNDGNWYAYIVDREEAANVDHGNDHDNDADTAAIVSGIDFGTRTNNDGSSCAITSGASGASALYCGEALTDVNTQKVPKSPKSVNPDRPTTWPVIQAYDFPSVIEIQYNKAGGTQITTLKFEDNAPGLFLDRSTYPPGATVHAIINDHRLNIDPTSADIWTWNILSQQKYYGGEAVERNTDDTANVIDSDTAVSAICDGCDVIIDANRQSSDPLEDVLEIAAIRGRSLPDATAFNATGTSEDPTAWFTVREIGGPNAGIFATTTLADDSILTIADDAQRGASATIDYDDSITGIQVQHSTATIEIQSPDGVWTSGSAIPIVVVDGDVNKNSRADDDLSVSDINSIVPTLVTGDPFTLSEISDEIIIWIGVNLNTIDADILAEYDRLIASANEPTSDGFLNYTHGYTSGFRLGGINNYTGTWATDPLPDADTLQGLFSLYLATGWVFPNPPPPGFSPDQGDDRIGIRSVTTVEEFSNRGIVSLPDLNKFTPEEKVSLGKLGITDFEKINASILAFDIGDSAHELRDTLIDTRPDSGETGFNMINYNVEVFEEGYPPAFVLVIIDGNYFFPPIPLGQKSGYLEIPTAIVDQIFDHDPTAKGFTQLAMVYPDNSIIVEYGKEYPVILDIFSFGFKNNGEASGERVANQIIRLELEEAGSDTGSLEGTLEYIMVNQLNINDKSTYEGLTTVGDEVSFIVIEDMTGSDAPSVTYLDVDTTGTEKQVSAQEDAPSHSAVVSLDVDSFKAADTVTVTLEDLDLNTDSGLKDIYTVVTAAGDANRDAVGSADIANGGTSVQLSDGSHLGRMLEITFDDQRWMTHTDDKGDTCTPKLNDNSGLGETNFSLIETGSATGIFVGTFPIPAEFCREGSEEPESVTGLDIEVNYVDFRDASGETTEVGDGAGIKASTGSVSLDRTVYPVPFGVTGDFKTSTATTPAQSNTNTRSIFPIHQNGMDDTTGLQSGEFLPQGDLIVYVTVTDPDFDVSASGRDSIAIDTAPVTVSVIRSSQSVTVATIGDTSNPIDEIAPGAGIFESSVTIRYNDGPNSSLCPSADDGDANTDTDDQGCILQGDILQVEYNDPTDASGQSNTVTDSATFDLRNGVLQSDKSVYIIGSDMILTLIEPDFDLDGSQNETYDLDLIKWSSSAATVTMGNADGEIGAFDPEPLSFRETGPSTGIFQVVVEIPQVLDGSSLQRGEEIDLEYTDWGPSGSDYVGDQDEDIRLTVFTSNFGATIDLDQKVYSWTDKVYITVVAPDHNFDDNLIDEIGETDEDPLRVATKGFDLDNYRLVETGFDTGIFTGEVTLTGFAHDPTGDGNEVVPRTTGNGPTDGYLQTPSDGGISVSYEFSEDETVFTSSIIRWNIGDVQWLEASYPASGTGVLRVIDPDMNLNPEAVGNFDVNVASDTDASGITLTVTETNEATGIFEGTVFFTTTGGSSGHRLRVSEGDTVTADYADGTLPLPYTANDSVSITSTTIIGTIVPPLERAPATNLRIVDTFGSSISAVSIDQQVQITADLSNGQDRDQDFAYLIQIQDSDGVTVSLSWIAGSLSSGQSFSPSASWTPTDVGTYTVTAFVWESIDNPTALSPPLTIDVSVNN